MYHNEHFTVLQPLLKQHLAKYSLQIKYTLQLHSGGQL